MPGVEDIVKCIKCGSTTAKVMSTLVFGRFQGENQEITVACDCGAWYTLKPISGQVVEKKTKRFTRGLSKNEMAKNDYRNGRLIRCSVCHDTSRRLDVVHRVGFDKISRAVAMCPHCKTKYQYQFGSGITKKTAKEAL